MYDLGSQFLVDYEGAKSITPLILQGQTYRFTILTERLIRLEYSLDGTFEDRPTDLVRFRNFPKVEAAIREDEKYLETDPLKVRANAYDVVLNGYELGSGSVRIFDQDQQQKVFEKLGLSDEDIHVKFGFFVDALKYGTPPHCGMGLGLDRIVMILNNSQSLRDVIAFPKNASAVCPMSEAPSIVDDKQLDELGLKIK